MKDYLRRNLWILSELYQNPKGLTYKEIADRWERSSQNILDNPLPKRTFADCLRAIEETFGIQISSDARNGYRYRIVNREWLENDNVKDWLLSAFAVNTLLLDSHELSERVMFEDIPSGNDYLLEVLKAMREDRVLAITYQDYYDNEPRDILLEPYCVRVFRQRWYVIGVMENESEQEEPTELTNQGRIRRYALDRVVKLEQTDATFKMPQGFSVDSYFADAFGIIVEPEEYDVETISLKVYDINHRREYLRSLPLHSSQHEIETTADYSVFELRLAPTYDFVQVILAMGNEVEVLAPEYVRCEIRKRVTDMCQLYKSF